MAIKRNRSVLQDWVHELTYMQQSVLIAATRGPDNICKNHVAKLLLRWMRRCFLISAFDGKVLVHPGYLGGGSFTGPSIPEISYQYDDGNPTWPSLMDKLVDTYLGAVDELPHHFQLHFMHATEIMGYKHPDLLIRKWWYKTYLRLVNDLHLMPESEKYMDTRLGDVESQWYDAEEVIAKSPEIEGSN